ncbi:pyridoxamine 5'-phosphate oxidase family protein [Actinomadura rupiterrae]|uniref:pyridoxamine 5'-phosphate oxidase family protein n=1 Tax=Actinomadura rupiterrae TaxID=559627 RepID=UPI0020A2B790|nr:pyridoxamine 5'-phosphate oxidase family protein [Actinomadura rupiterrae]MCP2337744.1 general stress protein 26 [Actinomadura rupiterrae]
MDAPKTQLDDRFSDPGAHPTTWEAALRAPEEAQITWISTVRADGRPHVTPLVAVWLDGALHFATGHEEQKAVNLTTNPNVVLTTGCNSWNNSLDVMVEGQARRVTDRPTLERLAAAWRNKWDGRWHYEVADEGFQNASSPVLVFAVEPTKTLAFGRHQNPETTTFTHTRHLPPK